MNPSPQPPPRILGGGVKHSLISILGVVGIIAVILIAFFLRFHNLGAQSFWNDEGNSYVQATRSFVELASNAGRDIHPPGYYWLLAIWRQFSGDSEFGLRALSAFASVLTVAFTYGLGKRLFNPAAGLLAALFVALNTFSIYYAQEARMYALLALWGVMGMWALTKVLSTEYRVQSLKKPSGSSQLPVSRYQKRQWIYWIVLALVNAAGLYTQYAYPFVMLTQGVVFLVWVAGKIVTGQIKLPLRILGWYVGANVLTILLYTPWIPTALHQLTTWPSTGQPIPAGEAIDTIMGWFTVGITYTVVPDAAKNFSMIVVVTVVGIFAWLLPKERPALWQLALPVLWVLMSAGLFLVLELFRPANLKFLLPSEIGFALFFSSGLMGNWLGPRGLPEYGTYTPAKVLWPVRLVVGIIVVMLGSWLVNGVSPLYTDPAFQRPNYREMVRQITADPRAGDAVILDAPNQEEVFRYYYKGDAPVYALPPGLGGNDAETAALTQQIIDQHERIFVLFWGEAERDPNHIVENLLDNQTFQAGIDQWYGDVRFVQYAAPAEMPDLMDSGAMFGEHITLEGYSLSATSLKAGDVLQVRLDWETDAQLDTAYKVFVHLLNSEGGLAAQQDSEPNSGASSTVTWKPGEMVTDRRGLAIPSDLPAGTYQLIVGLYNLGGDFARLPIEGGDYLDLGSITVNE
jgi:mannosyltransferase